MSLPESVDIELIKDIYLVTELFNELINEINDLRSLMLEQAIQIESLKLEKEKNEQKTSQSGKIVEW